MKNLLLVIVLFGSIESQAFIKFTSPKNPLAKVKSWECQKGLKIQKTKYPQLKVM